VETVGPASRDILLSVHLLAITCWIGGGFAELWLGRQFLSQSNLPSGAPLIRAVYRLDLFVFAATLVAFATGVALSVLLDWGFFNQFWLGFKQAIMLAVLATVGVILRPALRMGALIDSLPAGPGPASADIVDAYRRLEPSYLAMRAAAVVAVVLAVTRPVPA
jgi:hypothetical protein